MTHVGSVYFFFCQAEDGIRDLYVTGVQTCALPIFSTQYQKTLLFPQHKLIRRGHAWRRRAAVGCVQLCKPGATDPPRASVASDTCHGRWGVAGAATEVWQAVRQDRAAIDSAGEAVACATAPSSVHRAQRTNADGATELQPAVPLVRWSEHGRCNLGCDGVHEESPASAGR